MSTYPTVGDKRRRMAARRQPAETRFDPSVLVLPRFSVRSGAHVRTVVGAPEDGASFVEVVRT